MADADRRAQLATLITQRRADLQGADVSERLRDLSASGSRFPAPPRPTRSPVKTAVVVSVALAGLFLCAAVTTLVVAGGLWVQAQLGSPSTTVEDFYSAAHQQNYQQAYSYLAAPAQSAVSEAKFEQSMRATDLIAGGVQSYAVASTSTNGSSAAVTVDVVRQGNSSTADVYVVTLTQEQRTWRIVAIHQTGQTAAPTPSN